MRQRLEEEKRALASFVTEIDIHMRERTSFTSSLPRFSFSTPRSSLGGSTDTGGNRRRSLGAVLIESTNMKLGTGLGDVKEEEEKENVETAGAV